MDSYDNDWVLMLNDDLFWVGDEDAVDIIRTEPCQNWCK